MLAQPVISALRGSEVHTYSQPQEETSLAGAGDGSEVKVALPDHPALTQWLKTDCNSVLGIWYLLLQAGIAHTWSTYVQTSKAFIYIKCKKEKSFKETGLGNETLINLKQKDTIH